MSPSSGAAPAYPPRMARAHRFQPAGGTYHITTRGNRRQAIFYDDLDRELFLRQFQRVVRHRNWNHLAYCLMTNHFHLLIETPTESLSAGMHQLNGVYARKFNERHTLDGHLFDGRFRSVLVEGDEHFDEVLRYIAFNPVRAGLCEHPADWPWSSFRGIARRFRFDR
jgi:REP-associated tyrosine transposase